MTVPTVRPAAVLARLSQGHLGAETGRVLKAAAQQKIGVRRAAAALALAWQLLWRQSHDLECLVTALNQESGQRYTRANRYLRTMPGVEAATAPAISAKIGDFRRFTDANPLVALMGHDP